MCKLFAFSFLLLNWAIGLSYANPVVGQAIFDNTLSIVNSLPEHTITRCNLANVAGAPFGGANTALTPPASVNNTVLYLGIGSGYQNYTCASSTANPVYMGGIANIFDVSCIGNNTDLLVALPTVLQNIPTENTAFAAMMLERLAVPGAFPQSIVLAQHYATAAASGGGLVANFDLTPYGNKDFVSAKIVEQGIAPTTSTPLSANWLHLKNNNAATTISDVYRVWTSGGNATSCTDQPVLTIPYSAVYYFYGPPPK